MSDEDFNFDWFIGNGLDVIITRTKVRIRPSDQRALYFDVTHEQWAQFIEAAKTGTYDL